MLQQGYFPSEIVFTSVSLYPLAKVIKEGVEFWKIQIGANQNNVM